MAEALARTYPHKSSLKLQAKAISALILKLKHDDSIGNCTGHHSRFGTAVGVAWLSVTIEQKLPVD